ncbi:Na+/H+ antiporter NhaA [Streptomyces sp. ST1015]|uniref:Na+/H+ antiporter NhaA n=1 Tax=Streptomyces sp. ST1015 TaxID=1848900 RepID=UPI0039777689
MFTSPEPLGVVVGLVAGKTLGIFAGAYLAARTSSASRWLHRGPADRELAFPVSEPGEPQS